MNIRQLATQPGFEVIFKFLQGESLDAQTAAMECTESDEKKRLLVLTDAQRTAHIVGNLIRKLAAYQTVIQQQVEEVTDSELIQNLWNVERAN